MTDEQRKETFEGLKESCIEVSKNALIDDRLFNKNSPELIAALEHLLADLRAIPNPSSSSFDAQIANYVFYPLSHVLNKEQLGDRSMELVLLCMEFILQYGWNASLPLDKARELLAVVLYFIGDTSRSNETKLAGCRAMAAIYRAAVSSNKTVSTMSSLPIIAQSVSILLDCLECESIDLQLAALDGLSLVLFQIIADPDGLAIVVPGVVSKLTKLLTGKFGNCNYKVAAKALDLLSDLLSTVFNDADLQTKHANRTESWLKASKEQVRMSLSQIVAIRSHSKTIVQKSMLSMARILINCCSESLDVCLPALVDTVIYYADQGGSEYLSSKMVDSKVRDTLQERVYDWIESIPRLFTAHDDQMPVLILKSIQAGITILENNVDSFAMREALMNTLTGSITIGKAPVTPFKFDPSKMLLDKKPKEYTAFDNLSVVSNLSGSTQTALTNLLRDIGSSSMGMDLFQRFLKQDGDRLKSFWMAVNLLKGMTANKDETDEWLVSSDDNGDVGDAVYDVLATSQEIVQYGTSMKVSHSEVDESMVVVALDAIGVAAEYMGQDFELELVDNIYPIVSYLGSPNDALRRQAQQTVSQVAKSCGYPNVREMLVKNADYLVDGISIKLNTLDISPQTATILSTLIEFTGTSLTPYLDDLVATMFVILDNYHGYTQLTEGIFKVFQTLVEQTSRGYSVALIESKKHTMIQSYEELIDELTHKPEEPILSEPQDTDQGQSPDEDPDHEPEHGATPMDTMQEEEEKEWKSPVPQPAYKIVDRIVSYADLYLTHESSKLRRNLLQVVQDAIPMLSTSEKDFLPAVNNYWPVVVSKLNDSEMFVLEQALSVIGLTCEYAKDFMSKRITEILPRLFALLPDNILSKRPQFSEGQRRVDATVQCLEKVVTHTRIPEQSFDKLVAYFAPALHLDAFGPMRKALESVNDDAVWLEMSKIESTIY